MTLEIITALDRTRIIEALEIGAEEIEEGSSLYRACSELEERDKRFYDEANDPTLFATDPGSGLPIFYIDKLRKTLDSIELIQDKIACIQSGDNAKAAISDRTINIVGEYVESVKGTGDLILVDGEQIPGGTELATLKQYLVRYKRTIHRYLNRYKNKSDYPYGGYAGSGNRMVILG